MKVPQPIKICIDKLNAFFFYKCLDLTAEIQIKYGHSFGDQKNVIQSLMFVVLNFNVFWLPPLYHIQDTNFKKIYM